MTKLIDGNKYFVESKKAIQIGLESEELMQKQLKTEDKLQLVKNGLETVNSPEEYQELKKLKEELELKVRFNQYGSPAVPEEHKEKVKRNVVAEELEVNEKLNELKGGLKTIIENLENELLPLLDNIETLEKMQSIPNKVNLLLDHEISEKQNISLKLALNYISPNRNYSKAGEAKKGISKAVEALKKIEVPKETNRLLEFLKGGKK